jgi:RNA polymerase sigma-70 factor (ECF subfamily)
MTSTDTRSDEALLAAMAIGDETAGVAFVRRYQRRAFGLALSVVGDANLAEDIAQEALVRTWRHAPVYDSRRASVTTWVLTITRNLAIDALRMRRAVPIDPDDIVNLGMISSDPDPGDRAQRSDTSARVRQALAAVPPEQRRALVLSAFYGLTAEEISRQEDIPIGTAKTRIRAGLGKVRSLLAAAGHYDGPLTSPRPPKAPADQQLTSDGGRTAEALNPTQQEYHS